jgi:hypothetical protein
MKKEMFNLLNGIIEDKTSVMKEIILFLNENIEDYNYNENDNEETKYNKHKIREFIKDYKIYNKNDILNYILNCVKYNNWNLDNIKNFVEEIDTDATEFCYDMEESTYVAVDNLYDYNYYACEVDFKNFIDLLQNLK